MTMNHHRTDRMAGTCGVGRMSDAVHWELVKRYKVEVGRHGADGQTLCDHEDIDYYRFIEKENVTHIIQ